MTHVSRPEAAPVDGMSRRGWLAAAAAFLASSCVPDGPPEKTDTDGKLGQARAASGNAAYPASRRFAAWNKALRAGAPGRDVALVDLDSLDSNVDAVKTQLGPAFALRIVTKSLPSLDLIEYVMKRAGTSRLMAFSEGLLRAILQRFGATVDVLLGRPMPAESAYRVFRASPGPAKAVRWLVDTKSRMLDYVKLAGGLGVTLEVAVELDVGLRRGGARTATELLEVLEVIASHPKELHFAGFMGYDGHVPFAPPGFDSDTEFEAVQQRYADFVQAAKQAYPALFQGTTVFNSGGSGTYYRYGADLVTPVNEVAMGSAFVLPAQFIDLAALGLAPAIFLASPILKKIDPAEVPFAEGYLPLQAQSDPSLEVAYFMQAGGFPGDIVFPNGLIPSPYIPGGTTVDGLLPNQTLRNGSRKVPLEVGDFVFYHPWEGSGLAWLEAAELLRADKLTDRWSTLREGCLKGCGAPPNP